MSLSEYCAPRAGLTFLKNSYLHKSLHKSKLATNSSVVSSWKTPCNKCWK